MQYQLTTLRVQSSLVDRSWKQHFLRVLYRVSVITYDTHHSVFSDYCAPLSMWWRYDQ